MKFALTLVATMLSAPAFSQESPTFDNFAAPTENSTNNTALVIHGLSHHFHARANGQAWNEDNTGIGLRRYLGNDISGQIGVYRNSIRRTSAYVLFDYMPLTIGPVSFGGFVGTATGYNASPVRLIGGAVARVQMQRVSLAARIAPKAGLAGSAVATVEAGFAF